MRGDKEDREEEKEKYEGEKDSEGMKWRNRRRD